MRRIGFIAGLIAVVLLSVGPFLWIALTSLKGPAEIAARPPTLVPDGSLDAYRLVFEKHDLLPFLLTSLLVAGSTTVTSVTLGALAAYPLARMRFRFRRLVLLTVLFASMFPQIAIAGGVYRLLQWMGLLASRAGLVLPYTALTLPLAIWILVSFFRELPSELEDAARMDGCGPPAILYRVFLPVAAPSVFTAAILVFIYSWNEFFFALILGVKTLPVGIALFPGEHTVPWGEISAAAVIATAPLVVMVLLLQRRIVSGLTAGAVKG